MKHTAGPLAVQPLQDDHGASLCVVELPSARVLAIIPPMNEEDEPNYHSAERHPEDEGNAKLFAGSIAMLSALEEIAAGSDHDGRWLDEQGEECEESHPGATWHEFTAEEQCAWLASVAEMAKDAIKVAKGEA